MQEVERHVQSIAHIGWTTENPEIFEAFWCGILGFKEVHEAEVAHEMTKFLFDIDGGAILKRYKHPNFDTEIEIHIFADGTDACNRKYNNAGLSHICLWIDDREAFIKDLPRLINEDPDKKYLIIYDNPGGWKNMFLRDFEGNWVELRERL